jgi:hypothetical protein
VSRPAAAAGSASRKTAREPAWKEGTITAGGSAEEIETGAGEELESELEEISDEEEEEIPGPPHAAEEEEESEW